jgi:hypothetical protein
LQIASPNPYFPSSVAPNATVGYTTLVGVFNGTDSYRQAGYGLNNYWRPYGSQAGMLKSASGVRTVRLCVILQLAAAACEG